MITVENIFNNIFVSYHGIGDYDFIKLKSILEHGILPNIMLPNIIPRNTLMGNTDTKVYLVISPNIVGEKNATAYRSYIKNGFGIVVNRFPNEPTYNIKQAFPDAGILEGPIFPNDFLGITVPKEIYFKKIKDLSLELVNSTNSANDELTVKDLIASININKLPIYDADTGYIIDCCKDKNMKK